MPIDWDRPLRNRRGGRNRLGGLEIHYDFNWHLVFGHNRSTFRGGQSLAHLARRDCPEGKTPCLLLTEQTDKEHSFRETETDYVLVVPIHDYLDNAGPDTALSYYARHSNAPLTQLSTLSEAIFSADELGTFLDGQLTPEALRGWMERSPARIRILQGLIAPETDSDNFQSIDVTAALRDLTEENSAVLDEFVNYVFRIGEGSQLGDLLARITTFESGRTAAAYALAERLTERIADIKRRLINYEELIGNPDSTETDVQRFIENHPWIVGLPYLRTRPRLEIPRGEVDIVLERYDGFFDVMELKGPGDAIIIERNAGADRPPPASSYSLGPTLAAALAQTHHYRALFDKSGRQLLQEEYGLTDSREPRILIVLGSSTSLSVTSREILRQLNLSLHRVEIIPYDLLGTRTRVLLDNLEALVNG